MMLGKATKILLWLFLVAGLYGALSVSFRAITGTSPCPDVHGLPVCFVVTAGYLLMISSQFLQNKGWKKTIFSSGWLGVFLIAFTGTLLEVKNGNICPQSSKGLPLCYVSLGFCMLLLVLNSINQKYSAQKLVS